MIPDRPFPIQPKGQDRSSPDFSGVDIRGADFSSCNLSNANFVGAIAGLKPPIQILWIVSLIFAELLFAIVLEFAGQRSGDRFIYRPTNGLTPDEFGTNLWVAVFTVIMYVTSAVSLRQGIEPAFRITSGVGIAGILLTLGHVLIRATTRFAYANSGETIALYANRVAAPTITGGITGLALLTISVAMAIVITSAQIIKGKRTRQALALLAYGVVTIVGFFIYQSGNHPVTAFVSWIVGLAGVFLGNQTALQALKKDERFRLVKSIAIVLSSIGGTSFRNAMLSNANFSQAKLKSTDFRQSTLEHGNMNQTCWLKAKYLDYARFGNTILDDQAVRELLQTGEGQNGNYQGKNLKGAYLVDAKLTKADLTEADVSEATLERANLKQANLKKVQALGTNLYKTNLTGSCIEAWNVDSTTQLKGSVCEHVYLLSNCQERCPSSGDFQEAEFGKLFQKIISTVDFIFRNGVDWQAFLTAFEQVKIENEDTRLEIQSIENKGDDVVIVRVCTPPNANKKLIHSSFTAYYETELVRLKAEYEARLIGKEEQIDNYRKDNADLLGTVERLAAIQHIQMNFNAPVTNAIGKIMGEQINFSPGNSHVNHSKSSATGKGNSPLL